MLADGRGRLSLCGVAWLPLYWVAVGSAESRSTSVAALRFRVWLTVCTLRDCGESLLCWVAVRLGCCFAKLIGRTAELRSVAAARSRARLPLGGVVGRCSAGSQSVSGYRFFQFYIKSILCINNVVYFIIKKKECLLRISAINIDKFNNRCRQNKSKRIEKFIRYI